MDHAASIPEKTERKQKEGVKLKKEGIREKKTLKQTLDREEGWRKKQKMVEKAKWRSLCK